MKKEKIKAERIQTRRPHIKLNPGIVCPYCKGTGFRLNYTSFGIMQTAVCDVCGGKRYIPA